MLVHRRVDLDGSTVRKPLANASEIWVTKPEMPRPNIPAEDIPWLMEPGNPTGWDGDVHGGREGRHMGVLLKIG